MNIYRDPANDGYNNSTKRFELIQKVEFKTLFDFGSGPCSLHKWLLSKSIDCLYEAYDLRRDSLEQYCNCKKHFNIPNNKYDLVCLLGVSGLNTERNIQKTKELFVKTINQAVGLAKKYLLVNFSYQDKYPTYIIRYEEEEINHLLNSVNLEIKYVDKDKEMKEHIYMCELKA